MRTLIGSAVLAVGLIVTPALAQEHPSAHPQATSHVVHHGRAYGHATRGDGWRPETPAADDLYGSCQSSHPVFACPGG